MPAWGLFYGNDLAAFKTIASPDEATCLRGMGWAFNVGVIALPYYRETNPHFAGIAKRTIQAVIADGIK